MSTIATSDGVNPHFTASAETEDLQRDMIGADSGSAAGIDRPDRVDEARLAFPASPA